MSELAPERGLALSSVEGLEITTTSLSVVDPTLSYEDFQQALAVAGGLGDTARWWLGDLLVFGEARYGEQYAQAIEAGRLSERQLGRYRYVCERVARSRRREGLPFSYHEEVAPLLPDAQAALLDRAEEERWPRERLRDAVRDARVLAGIPPRRSPLQQEVLPAAVSAAGIVDAARGLSTVREALVLAEGHLRDGLGAGDLAERIPRAMRALDQAGDTIRRAADATPRAPLVDAARRVVEVGVRQRALPDPAYIVPAEAFEALAALLEEES